mmetsp:Transcript_6864/g.16826  ORF Transcript_6864/g.16826 Transcript_6864/m.16826 type:complete len:232 (-) Transcript_6864:22-717(-)
MPQDAIQSFIGSFIGSPSIPSLLVAAVFPVDFLWGLPLGLAEDVVDFAVRHLLQTLGHHCLLVVLQLLRIRHVLRPNPKQVRGAPAHAQDEHEDHLDIVAGLDGVEPEKLLQPVVRKEPADKGHRADDDDVLPVVAEFDDVAVCLLLVGARASRNAPPRPLAVPPSVVAGATEGALPPAGTSPARRLRLLLPCGGHPRRGPREPRRGPPRSRVADLCRRPPPRRCPGRHRS